VSEVRVSFDELAALLQEIFVRHGCSAGVARILALTMAGAERDGAHSHGIFRVDGNLGSLDSGWVDGKAEPVVEDIAPGMLRGDGGGTASRCRCWRRPGRPSWPRRVPTA
jgi:delta1-piperideine-2-carboxylate reductase